MTRLRRPHYPGDYAHVARCPKCNREAQAAFDDWYDTVPPIDDEPAQNSAVAPEPREYLLFSDNSNSRGQ
jgi:hypothetical protein